MLALLVMAQTKNKYTFAIQAKVVLAIVCISSASMIVSVVRLISIKSPVSSFSHPATLQHLKKRLAES